MSTPQAEIQAVDLTKTYGSGDETVEAVRGISFEVQRGEIFGLLGPNGAGKSTTIMMLATLLQPTSGTAVVSGFDVTTQSLEVRKTIGLALQETGMDDRLSGREILDLHGRLYGLGKNGARERANELIETVGLTDAADRRLGTYSGGMKRRIDLALALIHRPQLVYLDEPTTGLDPASRRSMWDEVSRLHESGVTVLLTTQYLEEADELADRIAIIDNGVIVASGTPEELKRSYGGPDATLDDVFLEVTGHKLEGTTDAPAEEGAE